MSGNNFFDQRAASAGRGMPLNNSRPLQNGKPAVNSTWFGLGQGSAPSGIPAGVGRGSNAGMTSFAQTLGGGQPHAPLDPSEFPSLGSNQQTQHNAPSQAIWGSSTGARGNNTQQLATVQRPQVSSQGQQGSGALISTPQQQSSEDSFVFSGLGSVGQLAGLSQTQSAGNAHTSRSGRGSPVHEEQRANRPIIPSFPIRVDPVSGVVPFRGQYPGDAQPGGGAENEPQSGIGSAALLESPTQDQRSGADKPITEKRLMEMTLQQRYSMPGMLVMFNREHEDFNPLALGWDIETLGFDLNSSEPLYKNFGTPFDNVNQRPILPDFTLPASYTVANVPNLESRVNTFTDETLFAIFYQFPRDLRQELAAQELYNRDWRWHKEMRQWMMKDTTMPPPNRIDNHTEDGYYIFFDSDTWKREKRPFRLNYEHLDQRPQAHQPMA